MKPICFKRKSNRLDLSIYKGRRAYFIICNTKDGIKVFHSKEIVDIHLKILKEASLRNGFEVIVYCFMPDHLHFLNIGNNDKSNLITFIKCYKQVSGFAHKKKMGLDLWQKSYYDHILRKEESIEDIVRYILENPVRKDLVNNARDYPFSGSFVHGKGIFNFLNM